MPQNPPEGMPRITPYLYYRDVAAAIGWLTRAFGFQERLAMRGPDDAIVHAELTLEEGLVMLGPASEERETRSPRDLAGVTQGLYAYVSDIRSHFAHAKESGAVVVSEPTEMFWGDVIYAVRDLEGHHWTFAEHVRDVAPEDMHPPG